jgi:hypothetical protein
MERTDEKVNIMSIRLFTIIVIGVCCLAFSQQAKANRVTVNTDVYYDATQNRMVGYTEAQSSYLAGMYYCLSVTVYLTTDTGQFAGNSAWDGCLYGYARTEATLPYDANAEYSVEGEHTAEPYYRNDLGQLMDYYNFQTYQDGFPDYYLWNFSFTGPGPQRTSIGAIFLGTAIALASQGTRHGPPHHLKIDKDEILDPAVTGTSCGQLERQITYQVVDASGRSAGRVTRGETFPGTIRSSCTGEEVPSTPCSIFSGGRFSGRYTDRSGKFKDTLKVGCPAATDDCGFTIDPNVWVWCSGGNFSNRTDLAKVVYDVRKRSISVGGRNTVWRRGTEFFADGTIRE